MSSHLKTDITFIFVIHDASHGTPLPQEECLLCGHRLLTIAQHLVLQCLFGRYGWHREAVKGGREVDEKKGELIILFKHTHAPTMRWL